LHRLSTTFLLGYHGCDRDLGQRLVGGEKFKASENDYDWLGSGIYFWESNPLRGLEFARQIQRWRREKGLPGQIKDPFVVGTAIDPGFCLDLTTSIGIQTVRATYDNFLEYCDRAGITPPTNTGGADLLLRKLDCAVINHLHAIRHAANLPPFDTVKGVFLEGDRIYAQSGFFEKTHIQICVRHPDCIKGVFYVPDDQLRGQP
jgi:hypothetical protein